MSTTTTSLSDTLPSSIPKLDASGINWAIFSVRLQDAIEAKGFWNHFDGSSIRPEQTYSAQVIASDGTTTSGGTAIIPENELAASQSQWDKDERSAKSLVTQKIPDSTLMRIHTKKTVVKRWNSIVMEYTEKGSYAQTDLRQKFLELKCPPQGNVREFLDNLRVKKEELATVGVIIEDGDYRSTILSSLPTSLANFASMQLAAARMFSSVKTISPDVLISLINEEADRQKVQKSRRQEGGKGKSDEKDEALFVGSNSARGSGGSGRGGSGRGRGRGGRGGWRGGHRRPNSSVGECWNCGETGHFKHNCPNPKKEDLPKKTGSANAADESDSDGNGVWAVETDSDSDGLRPLEGEAWAVDTDLDSDDSMPALEPLEDSDDDDDEGASTFDGASASDDGSFFGEEDWFSEPEEISRDIEIDMPEETYDRGSDSGQETSDEALTAAEPLKPGEYNFVQAELYDSGCTRHISPYREDFESFTEIPPMSFSAANKQKFNALGKGEMVIDIPNGVEISQLRLTEVLYSPEVGYTLVSIGRLDEKGFSARFGDGKCIIRGPDDECVGKILMNKRGLYKVEHELNIEEANAVEETITLEQLHRRLGHISPIIAKKLIEDNFVTGIRLDFTSSGDPFFCESCVYAKATRKIVLKAREGNRADVFAGEVHSDLWGPAPVETKGKKRYYITFTDDKTRLTNIYLLAKKSDAFESYKDYEAWCRTQLDVPVKQLHSDRGGEYLGKEFVLHLNHQGTKQKLTVHDTPQHNGVAERRNRTILERVRALLHSTGLPRTLWGEAARHVVWLMNRTSTKAVKGMTPYEATFGTRPDLSEVREWGERVWVRVEGGNKLGKRVREGRWMGMDEKSKGVRVYWPDTRTVGVERNVYVDKTGASASRLEGEEWDGFDEMNTDTPDIAK